MILHKDFFQQEFSFAVATGHCVSQFRELAGHFNFFWDLFCDFLRLYMTQLLYVSICAEVQKV